MDPNRSPWVAVLWQTSELTQTSGCRVRPMCGNLQRWIAQQNKLEHYIHIAFRASQSVVCDVRVQSVGVRNW
jgi:hypothetical protein